LGSIQPPPARSHNLTDLENIDNPGEEALAERLRRAQIQDLFQQLLKNPDLLKKFPFSRAHLEELQKKFEQSRDLKLPEGLRQALQQQPGNLPAGKLEELKKLLEGLTRDPSADLIKQLGGILSPQEPFNNDRFPGGLQPEPGKHFPTNPIPPIMSGPVPSHQFRSDRLKEFLTRHLNQIANNLRNSGYGEDSEAVRNLIKQLSQLGGEGGSLNLEGIKKFEKYLDSLSLPKLSLLNPENFGSVKWNLSLPKVRPPALPHIELPSINVPSLPSVPSVPSFSLGDSGTGLIWLALVVLLLVAAWKSRGWYRDAQAEKAGSGWQLGAWPVSPAQVTTRSDLVRAFEYLAFLCLGPSAGTCHHREVAERLGQQEGRAAGARREAAEQLAVLYEQARYAPEQGDGNEPLPANVRQSARQALCFLAGVNPA